MNRPILFLIGITIAIVSTCIYADSSAVTDSSNWITAFTTRPEVASQEDLCNKLVDSLSGKSDIRELLDLENFQLTFPTTADIIPQSGPGYFGEDGLKLFGQRLNALIEIKDSTISLLGADEVKQTCHVNVQLSFKVKATDLESPEGTSVVIVAQSWQDKFVAARLNFPSTQVYNHVSAVFLTEPQLHLKALAQGIYHFGYDSPCLAKTFFDKNSQITIDTPFGNLKFSGNTAISRAIDWISWHIHGRHHKRNNNGIEEFFRSLLLGDDSSNDNKYVSTIVNPERDSELLKKIEQTDEDECSNVQANDALATSIFSNDLMSTISSNMEYLRRGILGDSNNDIKSTIIDNNNQCHRDHFRSGTLPLLLPFVHFCDHVWTEDKQTVYDCFVPPITEKSRHFIPHRALHWLYLHGMTVRVTVDWTDDWKIGQINYTPMQQLGYVHGDWHSHAEPDSHHDQDHHDDHHDHHPHSHEEESSSKPVPPPSPHRPGFLNRRPRF